MKKFDQLDLELLRVLDNNSRLTVAELCKEIKASRDQVSYRLKQLEESQVILRYTLAINFYKIGYTLFKMYISLKNGPVDSPKLVNYLTRQANVFWIAEGDGRWDLMFACYATSAYQFSLVQDKLLNKFSSAIQSFDTYTVVDIRFYPKKYIADYKLREFYLGGESATEKPDSVDKELLVQLADNSRIPITTISNNLNLSSTAITQRIAKLEERKIINGYCLDLAVEKLGYESYKAQIYLKSYDNFKEFSEFCNQHPNVSCLIRQLGESKIEVEIDARDFDHYQTIVNEFRATYANSIRTVKLKKQIFLWLPPD